MNSLEKKVADKIMISLRAVKKKFKDTIAVNGISFDIYEGEVFGLLGPNGAGKTTTINLITGLLDMDEGEIYVNNLDIRRDRAEIRSMIGLCPQEIALVPHLNGYENAKFFGSLQNMATEELKRSIEFYFNKMGLSYAAKKVVKSYSGGMKRRLNLLVSLLNNPPILYLDEPTVGLDPQSRKSVWDLIKSFKGKKTIILTTHYIEEAEELCDRVAIIDHGKIIALGTPLELKKQMPYSTKINIWLKDFNDINKIDLDSMKTIDILKDIEVDSRNSLISLYLKNGLKHLGKILSYIKESMIEDIQVEQTNLENLFIHLTGREIRAED
ncbi:MAG: ABC transporter ATP-binding protein [Promethearchaeota archaeon]